MCNCAYEDICAGSQSARFAKRDAILHRRKIKRIKLLIFSPENEREKGGCRSPYPIREASSPPGKIRSFPFRVQHPSATSLSRSLPADGSSHVTLSCMLNPEIIAAWCSRSVCARSRRLYLRARRTRSSAQRPTRGTATGSATPCGRNEQEKSRRPRDTRESDCQLLGNRGIINPQDRISASWVQRARRSRD